MPTDRYLWDYNSGVPLATLADDDIFRVDQYTGGATPYETNFVDFATLKTQIGAGGTGTGKTPPAARLPFVSTGTNLGDEDWNTATNYLNLAYWDLQPSEPASSTVNQFYLIDDSGTTRAAIKSGSDAQKLIAYLSDITGGTSPLTTKGDIWAYSTLDARFPVSGNDGYVLTEDSTQAFGFAWKAAPSGTVPTPTAIGDMLYSADGATWTKLAIGSDNQVLTVNVNVPNWESSAGAGTFLGLSDTPASFTARRLMVANSLATALAVNTSTDTINYINLQADAIQTGNQPKGTIAFDDSNDRLCVYTADNVLDIIPITDDLGITVQDEGTPLTTLGTTLNFVGAGVTASGTGATKTITIPGGGSASPLTTKGDLYTFDTADARFPLGIDGAILKVNTGSSTGLQWKSPAAKGVLLAGNGVTGAWIERTIGTNGQVLTADSTETTGMKWATPASLPTPSSARNVLVTNSTATSWVENSSTNTVDYLFLKNDTIQTGNQVKGTMAFDDSTDRLAIYTADNVLDIIPIKDDLPTTIYKTAAQSVTNSTVYVDDTHLQATLSASTKYKIKIRLVGETTSATPGLKIQLVAPSVTGSYYISYCADTSNTTAQQVVGRVFTSASGETVYLTSFWKSSNIHAYELNGIFETDTTGGTFKIQWAQSTADASATSIYKGSFMEITKV